MWASPSFFSGLTIHIPNRKSATNTAHDVSFAKNLNSETEMRLGTNARFLLRLPYYPPPSSWFLKRPENNREIASNKTVIGHLVSRAGHPIGTYSKRPVRGLTSKKTSNNCHITGKQRCVKVFAEVPQSRKRQIQWISFIGWHCLSTKNCVLTTDIEGRSRQQEGLKDVLLLRSPTCDNPVVFSTAPATTPASC